jgi:hypothetical protein
MKREICLDDTRIRKEEKIAEVTENYVSPFIPGG